MIAIDDINNLVETSLRRSDKWNVGQKIGAAVLLLTASVLLLVGTAEPRVVVSSVLALTAISFLTLKRRVVESEAFVLRDRDGAYRAVLATHKTATHFVMFDHAGKKRLILSTDENGLPSLNLLDSSEHPRVGVAGTLNGGHVVLLDGSSSEVSGEVDGQVRIRLELSDRGPGLNLATKDQPKDGVFITDGMIGVRRGDGDALAMLRLQESGMKMSEGQKGFVLRLREDGPPIWETRRGNE